MRPDPSHVSVLVFCADRDSGALLGRWIAEVGERPVLLTGDEKYYLEDGDDATVDLVVSDLEPDDPAARSLAR